MTTVVFSDPLLDVRALEARAAGDLATWLEHIELEGKADRTVYEYAKYGVRFLKAFDRDVADYTDSDIVSFLRSVPAGASRKGARSALSGWFGWLRMTRRIPENPMDFVPKMNYRSQPISRWFSEADVALLEGIESPDGELLALMFGTGIRRDSCRHLQRRHINLESRMLVVEKAKGGKKLLVPMLERAVAAVAKLDLLERLNPDDYLWYTKPGGGKRRDRRRPMSDSTFDDWWQRCMVAAGLPDDPKHPDYLTPHKTRHTYATHVRSALRLDLDELQLFLGHSSISTTSDLYVHTTVEEAARRLFELEAAAQA